VFLLNIYSAKFILIKEMTKDLQLTVGRDYAPIKRL